MKALKTPSLSGLLVAPLLLLLASCERAPTDPASGSADQTPFFHHQPGHAGGPGGGGGEGEPADPAIAFVVTAKSTPELRVVDSDGGNESTVFTGVKFGRLNWPTWSADGGRIAFTGSFLDGLALIDVTVTGGSPVGGNLTVLSINAGFASYPAWSPDPAGPLGDVIALADGSRTPSSLRVISANGGPTTTIYTNLTNDWLRWPAWSRDANEIAFVLRNPSNTEVVSIQAIDVSSGAGGSVREVLSAGQLAGIGHLDWSRDGSRIAFEARSIGSTAAFPYQIYLIDADGTDLTAVAEGTGPSWSPDDSELAFSDRRGRLKAIDLASGSVRQVVRSGRKADWKR